MAWGETRQALQLGKTALGFNGCFIAVDWWSVPVAFSTWEANLVGDEG